MISTLRANARIALAAVGAICITVGTVQGPSDAAPPKKDGPATPVLPWKATWEAAIKEALDRNVPIVIEWHKDY